MLKTDIIWPNHRRYKSRTEWEPIGFFSDCLCNATNFDLMLGFFSSSAINVLSYGFASFLYNGGKMRLIANNILTPQDKQAIIDGQTVKIHNYYNLSDIASIQETLSKRDRHFFECLSYLISNNRLELVIIEPKDGVGMSHTKSGVFYDGENKVAFDGSCNFSKTALIDNIESLTAACDWDGEIGKAKVEIVEADFEDTFEGNNDSVQYLNAAAIKTSITSTFTNVDLITLLQHEEELIISELDNVPDAVRKVLLPAKENVAKIITAIKEEQSRELLPCFPYSSGPREYQQIAFENWKNNGQKGLFAMATGTGKTITSLNCLLEIYKRLGYYKAIILVPTITLVNQWEIECRKFHFNKIIKVCSNNKGWREEIGALKAAESLSQDNKGVSFVVIATYASFARQSIFDELNSFQKNRVLLIADEAHNMGAGQIKKRLDQIKYGRRIGLSATPDRQYDISGNNAIKAFFNAEDKYTYEYGMKEAIDNGVLCKYYYYPHIVRLTGEEMNQYLDISIKIVKYITYHGNDIDKPDSALKKLLLARKRIIHKAEGKIAVFKKIIYDRLRESGCLKYTLVYVPEGNSPDTYDSDIFEDHEEIRDDELSNHLIDIYTKIVLDTEDTMTVKKFTSDSTDREEILKQFADGDIQVLTSMKCLDEGVDVPRSEMAIFCSSTGNPRQFIQRRGRILRKHKDKDFAIIHDFVVVPNISSTSDSYSLEQKLLKNELIRVKDFAQMSLNASDTQLALKEVMQYYKLNLYNNN